MIDHKEINRIIYLIIELHMKYELHKMIITCEKATITNVSFPIY